MKTSDGMTTPRSPRTEADPEQPRQEFDLRYPFRTQPDGGPCWCMSKDEPHEDWFHSPLCNEMFRRWWAEAAAPRSGEGLRGVRDVVVGLPCLGNHTGGTPCDRNVVWRTAVLEAIDAAIAAEAAAPRSGEGLDAADRHEGPTPRDCPECLRLHDDEAAAPREASEPLRNAGEVMRNGPSKATSLPDELPFSVAPREASEPPST